MSRLVSPVHAKALSALETLVGHCAALVLDFDGVIVESVDIKCAAFVELFADHPQHQAGARQHFLQHAGISRQIKIRWVYEHLLNQPLDDQTLHDLCERFSALVMGAVCEAPLVPGAAQVLENAAAAGLSLSIASGTPQQELERILERRGLAGHFQLALGSPMTKPEMLMVFASQQACAPQQLLFVGDGESDLLAAREAGVPFIARRLQPEAWQQQADVVIDDLTTLARAIADHRVPGGVT